MITIRGLTLRRGSFRLPEVNFTIPRGAYAVMMGPTGCGKTSLLECIAGLVVAESGSIQIEGQEVSYISPAERGIGYVPQDGALFAGLSVRENLGFPLNLRGARTGVVKRSVEEFASVLGISHLLERGISKLSGGERQRVALGRALIFQPKLMLLDEPLAALDEGSREAMCELLATVQRESGTTFLHVTHSEAEAERLATLRLACF